MPDARRLARMLLGALLAAFGLFLLLQPGSSIDEGEHLHVAWLIAARGMHPVRDFFEHHTPILWHVLGLAYRAGVNGPEVLYAGRILVVACAAVWCWTLAWLAKRWSRGSGALPLPGVFSVAAFAAIAFVTPELVVVRPETLSLALFGAALLFWTAERSPRIGAAATGALATLAALTSPRFAVMAPILLVATADGAPRWPSWQRALAGALGAVAMFAAFLALCPWSELLYDLRFSGLLQSIPSPLGLDLRFLSIPAAVVGLLGGILWTLGNPPPRSGLAWMAIGAFLCIVCAVGSGGYLYAQGFAPLLAWLSLIVAWLEARPLTLPDPPRFASITLGSVLALALVQLFWATHSAVNVPGLTASRRLLLDALPSGGRVLLHTTYHPLTFDDASYWGSMLIDGPPGRGCEAAEMYRAEHPGAAPAPRQCDFIHDLATNRPFAVHRTLGLAARPDQFEDVSRALQRGWTLTDTLNEAPMGSFAANVMFRR